jgi:septal ring factor EnvC (AmiA/AmiB activator)
MNMRRRSLQTGTTLDQKQQELVLQETALRDQVEKLERMIAEAPRVAEETTRRQREELLQRASEGSSRLDVSVALQDKRYGDDRTDKPRRGSLRKERREGRIVFLVLVIVLTAVVIWLASHFHF